MSNAFKYFCIHLYGRYYQTIVSYQGLEREVHNFPYYATKVTQRFNQERFLVDNVNGEHIPLQGTTIPENQCCVAMLINGSMTETSTPVTGPDGNYFGAMRKEHAYIMQQTVYLGYKKLHGHNYFDMCLPNGIHYI